MFKFGIRLSILELWSIVECLWGKCMIMFFDNCLLVNRVFMEVKYFGFLLDIVWDLENSK